MSTALSGPAAELGKGMQLGVTLGLERANRGGGVHGRKLRLEALDDGYEPSRTAPNMRQLIENDRVLAVIGNVGTPTAIAAVPIATKDETLFFAGFTGAGVLRSDPPNRYVINFRASYAEETRAMIDALIDQGGLKPEDIAFFTQSDAYGDAGFSGGIAALKRHGLADERTVLHLSYARNSVAVEDAVASLLYAPHEPRAVVMVGAYAPCAKFIALCREAELNAVFLNVSFVGSNPLAIALGKTAADVIVTQVVPSPHDGTVPIVAEYLADLRAYDPSLSPRFGSLEGYVAARIMVKALERISGAPTRESVVDALEGLGKFDLGLGEPLSLGPVEHQACHRIWPTVLKNGIFVPFDWHDLTVLLRKDGAS